MKKIKYLALTFASVALLSLSSCQDAYEIVQDGELNEESFKTLGQMESYLSGVYGSVSIANEIGFTGVFTDETGVGRGSGGQNFGTHRYIINTSNPFAQSIWYTHYLTISRCNRLLKIATQVPVPTDPAELARYNSAMAQARALRAFSYLQLLTYFSTDMTDDNALGVIFFGDNIPKASDELPRVANSVIYTAMEADLQYAFDNVTDNVNAGATPYKYVTKNMVNALRARFYLYRGNYTLAKQYAEYVIANAGVSLTLATPIPAGTVGSSSWNTSFYGASSTNPYRRMFNDNPATSGSSVVSRGEIIFSLLRPAAGTWENIASQFTTNTTNVVGSPLFEVGRNLFNELSAIPGDIRRYANVDPSSLINPSYATSPDYLDTDVIVIDKYPGQTGYPLRNDVKVFRLSEMYLILAECHANAGNINGASNSVASVIKQIRDARNFQGAQALPTYADATAAWKAIMDERRYELCFEGHRYIDVKRLGGKANASITRDATDDIITNDLTLPYNDYRFTLPIPQDELNANTVIRTQQNPGY